MDNESIIETLDQICDKDSSITQGSKVTQIFSSSKSLRLIKLNKNAETKYRYIGYFHILIKIYFQHSTVQ